MWGSSRPQTCSTPTEIPRPARRPRTHGFFSYVEANGLTETLQKGDLSTFIRRYNGSAPGSALHTRYLDRMQGYIGDPSTLPQRLTTPPPPPPKTPNRHPAGAADFRYRRHRGKHDCRHSLDDRSHAAGHDLRSRRTRCARQFQGLHSRSWDNRPQEAQPPAGRPSYPCTFHQRAGKGDKKGESSEQDLTRRASGMFTNWFKSNAQPGQFLRSLGMGNLLGLTDTIERGLGNIEGKQKEDLPETTPMASDEYVYLPGFKVMGRKGGGYYLPELPDGKKLWVDESNIVPYGSEEWRDPDYVNNPQFDENHSGSWERIKEVYGQPQAVPLEMLTASAAVVGPGEHNIFDESRIIIDKDAAMTADPYGLGGPANMYKGRGSGTSVASPGGPGGPAAQAAPHGATYSHCQACRSPAAGATC